MLKRYGAVATIEWQPSDSFHSTFDARYSHLEEAQHLRGIEFPLGFSDPNKSNIVVDNGFATATKFDNVYAIQRNDYKQRMAETLSLGWNNERALHDTTRRHDASSRRQANTNEPLLDTP